MFVCLYIFFKFCFKENMIQSNCETMRNYEAEIVSLRQQVLLIILLCLCWSDVIDYAFI